MTPHIPGYRIVRTLGKGGMATVYLAVQDIFERAVALKVMEQSLADDPTFSKRFFREARIVSQLVHPNIVTVFDVGVHEGAFYLSMEYIEGQDLKQARKQLNLKQKIQVVQDIARALEFAAHKGYVHRDIKPENIMIAKADQRAVLMDFGIARAAETDLSVTQTGLAIGTPHYMSPEQAKGKAVDARSDLYSLGVVFYLLLTGKVPFDGDSAVAIGIKHITETLPLLPDRLAAAQPIVSTLLAKSPADRFQQPEDLIAALEDLKSVMSEEPNVELEEVPANSEWVSAATLVEVGSSAVEPDLLFSNSTGQVVAADDLKKETVSNPDAEGGLSWLAVGIVLIVAASVAALILGYFYTKPKPETPFAVLTGGNDTSLGQLKSNIALVAKAYQKSDTQLPVLVKLYRDLQKAQPNDNRAEQELNTLAEQQLKRLTWALNSADYDQASLLDRNLRMLFPEYVSNELARQEARLNLKEQVKLLLLNAVDYEKSGADFEPAGANAREAYESILALDPDITVAREALATLRQKPQASERLNAAGVPGTVRTTGEKLIQARQLTEAGNLFAPVGQNAYALYAQILTNDPGNPEARQGSAGLWQALPNLTVKWAKEGAYAKAAEQLNAAEELKPNDKNLLQLHQSLDEKIVERNRNLLPKVTGLRVAGFPVESFDDPQAQSLSVSKALHLRISVEKAGQQKVRVNLYQGARVQLVIQATFDLHEGLAQWKIDPPDGSFTKGAYTLDLIVEGQIIETLRFRID